MTYLSDKAIDTLTPVQREEYYKELVRLGEDASMYEKRDMLRKILFPSPFRRVQRFVRGLRL